MEKKYECGERDEITTQRPNQKRREKIESETKIILKFDLAWASSDVAPFFRYEHDLCATIDFRILLKWIKKKYVRTAACPLSRLPCSKQQYSTQNVYKCFNSFTHVARKHSRVHMNANSRA